MKFIRVIKSYKDITFKYYGANGYPHAWENLNCKIDIEEFKDYLRTTSPSDIIDTWRKQTGSTETPLNVTRKGDNGFLIKFKDPFGNISYLYYELPEDNDFNKWDYPNDDSKSKKYTDNERYDIILDGEFEKTNIDRQQIIEYYNELIKEYYDSLRMDVTDDEFSESLKIGPKITNNFQTAVNGLKELDRQVRISK